MLPLLSLMSFIFPNFDQKLLDKALKRLDCIIVDDQSDVENEKDEDLKDDKDIKEEEDDDKEELMEAQEYKVGSVV